MNRTYEGDQTRQLALKVGYIPVVPPKTNRLEPGNMTALCSMYEKHNEIVTLILSIRPLRNSYDALREYCDPFR